MLGVQGQEALQGENILKAAEPDIYLHNLTITITSDFNIVSGI